MSAVLFVCLGNICRSPTAEAVMREHVRRAGLEDLVTLDSAGTGGWHVGAPPDARAVAAAARRGIAMEGAARQVRAQDWDDFDVIVAMDRQNLDDLWRLAPDEQARGKLRLLLGDGEVPDPYYGSQSDFEAVLDLAEGACGALLEELHAGSRAQ